MPNRWIISTLLCVATGGVSLGTAEKAFACRCREPAPPRAYRAAQSVVYGTIVSVRRENQGADVVYVFEVAESWKRPLEPEITVHSGTTCSFEANAGEKYVIFLKQYKAETLETAQCMGNTPEAKAGALLVYLRSIKSAK
jgi:hypothetical protein